MDLSRANDVRELRERDNRFTYPEEDTRTFRGHCDSVADPEEMIQYLPIPGCAPILSRNRRGWSQTVPPNSKELRHRNGKRGYMEKMIMIPEWRYNKMVESFDKAVEELEALRAELLAVKGEKTLAKKGDGVR